MKFILLLLCLSLFKAAKYDIWIDSDTNPENVRIGIKSTSDIELMKRDSLDIILFQSNRNGHDDKNPALGVSI